MLASTSQFPFVIYSLVIFLKSFLLKRVCGTFRLFCLKMLRYLLKKEYIFHGTLK